ncbi:MAG: hypothetical protein EAX81_07980 [Candidatus Thorarchaeota archaeon]|nr:hypothetical protein [Candidatus Thorarchaeota archaeon]
MVHVLSIVDSSKAWRLFKDYQVLKLAESYSLFQDSCNHRKKSPRGDEEPSRRIPERNFSIS